MGIRNRGVGGDDEGLDRDWLARLLETRGRQTNSEEEEDKVRPAEDKFSRRCVPISIGHVDLMSFLQKL